MSPESEQKDTVLYKKMNDGFGIYVNLSINNTVFFSTYGVFVKTSSFIQDNDKLVKIITKAIDESSQLIERDILTHVNAVSHCAKRCHDLMLIHMKKA